MDTREEMATGIVGMLERQESLQADLHAAQAEVVGLRGVLGQVLEQAEMCWLHHYGENPEGSSVPEHIALTREALSTPLTDNAVAELVEALRFYASNWRLNWDGDDTVPGGSRSWGEPTDDLLNDEGKKARTALTPFGEMT